MFKLKIPDNVSLNVNKGVMFTKKHAPEILTITGIVGGVVTVYFAVKASKKLDTDLGEICERMENGEIVDNKEKVKIVVKDTLIPILTGAVSVSCLVYSNVITKNRLRSLSQTLAASYANYNMYKYKVAQEVGPEKAEELAQPVIITQKAQGRKKAEGVLIDDVRYNCCNFAQCGIHTDDPEYNLNIIKDLDNTISMHFAKTGYLSYNQLVKYLRLETGKTLPGHGIGWSQAAWTGFDIKPVCCINANTGKPYDEYILSWAQPIYIYEDVDYMPEGVQSFDLLY